MKRLFLIVPVVTLAAFVARAQQESKPAASAPEATLAGAKAPATKQVAKKAGKMKQAKAVAAVEEYQPQPSEYGRKAKCPVMGTDFTVGADTPAVKYKGKVYYFCCTGCPKKFKATPDKYAK